MHLSISITNLSFYFPFLSSPSRRRKEDTFQRITETFSSLLLCNWQASNQFPVLQLRAYESGDSIEEGFEVDQELTLKTTYDLNRV
jgi:hypothetical protein